MGILALKADERVSSVSFTADSLIVALMDGRTIIIVCLSPGIRGFFMPRKNS
jgi:hypothetical protein